MSERLTSLIEEYSADHDLENYAAMFTQDESAPLGQTIEDSFDATLAAMSDQLTSLQTAANLLASLQHESSVGIGRAEALERVEAALSSATRSTMFALLGAVDAMKLLAAQARR